jgi:hypothetical protein
MGTAYKPRVAEALDGLMANFSWTYILANMHCGRWDGTTAKPNGYWGFLKTGTSEN